MRDYNIHIRIGRSGARRDVRSPHHCDWNCAYCKGNGVDPAGIMGTERCPGCQGNGWWEADVNCNRLLPCGRCRGSGRIEVFGFLKPCDVCGGSGKV